MVNVNLCEKDFHEFRSAPPDASSGDPTRNGKFSHQCLEVFSFRELPTKEFEEQCGYRRCPRLDVVGEEHSKKGDAEWHVGKLYEWFEEVLRDGSDVAVVEEGARHEQRLAWLRRKGCQYALPHVVPRLTPE
jgi:hypothetical protein